ncbi:hypothetical protein FRC08_001513 [Ceratobasidium sp. 394]|nr:hypothetical protein FRC08_001513 [Ceratobasidium sp. 394]
MYPAKSHHRNQLPTYCHCEKCKGKIKQKPRTIDDHRTRYPRQPASPGSGAEGDDAPAGSIVQQYIGGDYPEDIMYQPRPQSSSPVLSPQPASPAQHDESDDDHEHVMRLSSSPRADTPPVPPPGRQIVDDEFRDPIEQVDNAGQLPDDEMDLDREYPFDRLLDDIPNEHHEHDELLNLDEYNAEPEEIDLNDELDNENFGLPDDEARDPEAELPHFQPGLGEFDEELGQMLGEDLDNDEGDPRALCVALEEHELIRNAYIDAFIQKSVYGATHRALKHQLKAARRTIAANPNVSAEDIANMAQTIGTAENRLGVNTDRFITTFTLCPTCKRRYSPEYIATTDNPTCLNEGCEGILFTLRNLASGGRRRVSNETYPFASPIAWVRHMLSLPGMAELMQTWRSNQMGDHGLSAPISSDEWMRTLDVNRPLGDITDGWGWRSTFAGLERHEDLNTGNVTDENVLEPPIRFVSLPFGLSFSLNTDW